jgi:selenocysteine-specific elongation factor
MKGQCVMIGCPDFSESHPNASTLQFTFVDCPGHASLIRTIIGGTFPTQTLPTIGPKRCSADSSGAQIIDMMLLVIDITKGIQTQTAEVP